MGMIDVGEKDKTVRIARSHASIRVGRQLIKRIKDNDIPKGNVLEAARIAGILAAKKTPQLLPLCHPIELEKAAVEFSLNQEEVVIEAVVKATAKTGVEMEALSACSIAALTIYDMCKMFSKSIEITELYLIEKKGGKSGIYRRKSN